MGERIPHIISSSLAQVLRWSISVLMIQPLTRSLGHSITHTLSNQLASAVHREHFNDRSAQFYNSYFATYFADYYTQCYEVYYTAALTEVEDWWAGEAFEGDTTH